ncbi:MAG: TatD family deoxyribonuclease [Dehalococcoidia bacterium]|nr:TatD family deoxyribonuclease [Dehalococcoidia bacterium]
MTGPVTAPIIDAHAHITSKEFAEDREAALHRAWDAGLVAIIEAGDDVAGGRRALELARREPRVHAVTGLHPNAAARLSEEREALQTLLETGEYVGVGEIGLDFYRDRATREQQFEAFRWQLELAREVRLPVVIHSRDADAESYAELDAWAARVGRYLGPDREVGMLHCFAGDAALAARYVGMGFLISVPGTVTYRGNDRAQEVARTVPLAAMLVETDAPYLAPRPHRGTRNEPAYVVETARFVAALRGCNLNEVARATAENAARLFGFSL